MRNPLLPIAALAALVILVCEGFFGIFSKWSDPSRSPSHYVHYVEDGDCWMRLRVDDIPEARRNTLRATATVLEVADSTGAVHPCQGKILLFFEKSSTVRAGDELVVLAAPRLPNGADNPHQFDYRRDLRRKGILRTAYIPSAACRVIAHSDKGLKAKTTVLRQRLIEVIHFSSLSPSQQGIAEALILGWRGDLDAETQSQFRTAGITHLLCVSGLHVGIVALIIGWCLGFLSNRRTMRIVKGSVQIAAIWLFVVVTGMAPSTMRAGLMFSLIVIGQMFFSRPPTLNAIAASALILLAVNPLMLFEVGFQLSYCAVIAIVVLVRPLEELMPLPDGESRVGHLLFRLLKKIRTLLCVSLVAQLATTPLTLFYFHSFPPYFLVANMIIIPFATLLLGSILLMIAVSWWPLAFKAAGWVVSALLSATEYITSTVSSWPNALIENIYFDGPMLVISASIVLTAGWLLLKPRWSTAAIALATTLVLVLYARTVDARCAVQRHCDIYNVGNRTAIEFFIGKESILLCDSATAANPHSIDYQTANNLIWHKAKRTHILALDTTYEDANIIIKNRFVGFDGKSMRIVDRSNCTQRSLHRVKLNYLLLRESPYVTIEELKQQYDFDSLIYVNSDL